MPKPPHIDNPSSPPIDPNAWGQLRSMLAQAGIPQSEIDANLGTDPSNRSRMDIAAILKGWL